MSDDLTLPQLIHRWPRIVARARTPWQATFALRIAKLAKQPGWKATARQLEAMRDLHDELGGDVPLFGEEFLTRDGRRFSWSGPINQWVEVRS